MPDLTVLSDEESGEGTEESADDTSEGNDDGDEDEYDEDDEDDGVPDEAMTIERPRGSYNAGSFAHALLD